MYRKERRCWCFKLFELHHDANQIILTFLRLLHVSYYTDFEISNAIYLVQVISSTNYRLSRCHATLIKTLGLWSLKLMSLGVINFFCNIDIQHCLARVHTRKLSWTPIASFNITYWPRYNKHLKKLTAWPHGRCSVQNPARLNQQVAMNCASIRKV